MFEGLLFWGDGGGGGVYIAFLIRDLHFDPKAIFLASIIFLNLNFIPYFCL